jgi:hypothetical protein
MKSPYILMQSPHFSMKSPYISMQTPLFAMKSPYFSMQSPDLYEVSLHVNTIWGEIALRCRETS